MITTSAAPRRWATIAAEAARTTHGRLLCRLSRHGRPMRIIDEIRTDNVTHDVQQRVQIATLFAVPAEFLFLRDPHQLREVTILRQHLACPRCEATL